MGLSGFIIKKKDLINAEQTINEVKTIAEKLNLKFTLCKKTYDEQNNLLFSLFKIYDTILEDGFIFYLYSTHYKESSFDEHEFDWIKKDEKLLNFLMIEAFSEREKMLLDFLSEYFEIESNRNDYFWCEMDWYFDYEAIKKLKKAPFDKDWPYKPPK